ncbi:hypothetical protein D8W73_06945 [Citrobacter amalonaticus]|nr:hypothetical protein [Citrobacter amalonaticus]
MAVSHRGDTALVECAQPADWPDVDNASCCIPRRCHTDIKTSTDSCKMCNAETVLADLYVK